MLANSNLPAEDDVVLNGDAAGEPGLRRDDNDFSDAAVVSDVHEIVDLGAASDARFIQRSAADGRVGPDFYAIFDHQFSDLRKFLVVAALAISHIAEAVAAQHRSRVHNDAIAQRGLRINCHIRINLALPSYLHTARNRAARADPRVFADLRLFAYCRMFLD